MRAFSTLLVSAFCLAALPAAADVHQLGSVNVSADHFTHVLWSRFEGPVKRLRLVPDTDTVECEHITVTYRNGDSYDVFQGTLVKDSTETITFPRDGDTRVRDVDFACRAQNVDGAHIALYSVSEGDPDFDRPAPARVRTDETARPIDR